MLAQGVGVRPCSPRQGSGPPPSPPQILSSLPSLACIEAAMPPVEGIMVWNTPPPLRSCCTAAVRSAPPAAPVEVVEAVCALATAPNRQTANIMEARSLE